ncbi:hypothetical protein [Bosea sp. Tri-44]|uniref:hypothetical protein n=1 Tax=Bosea sp. Tri-44 TaxID=1972137 RepID=UPI00100F345C|nr:hypothetical protein [Bosea sp. Tri-44]
MEVLTRATAVDPSKASRNVVTGSRDNFTGYFPSRKNGRLIQYESLLEQRMIRLMEADKHIVEYTDQPKAKEWRDGSYRTRCSTFDFEYIADDGTVTIVEVKPWSRVQKKGLLEEFAFARFELGKQGYNFELWTDRELNAGVRLANAEILSSSDTAFSSDELLIRLRNAIFHFGDRATVAQLRYALDGEARTNFAWWGIARLIARGEFILCTPDAPLDDNAIVSAFRASDSPKGAAG